jgi:hypothetical protein
MILRRQKGREREERQQTAIGGKHHSMISESLIFRFSGALALLLLWSVSATRQPVHLFLIQRPKIGSPTRLKRWCASSWRLAFEARRKGEA